MGRFLRGVFWLTVVGAACFWIVTSPSAFSVVRGRTFANLGAAPNLDNGKTIFWAGGCASCHATPNQDDRMKLGGGEPLASPFGTFYAPNISPHPRDGIGAWTVQQFARAMTSGVSPDGRHYYPSFPYMSYQRMSDADLRDLFGFMKSLPAVEGKARDHGLPFPFNIRRTLGGWKWLYLDGRPFVANAQDSAALNRGAYLVEGPGHCAECHSPRNALGGVIRGMRFSGGTEPDGRGTTPNLTSHPDGLSGWTVDEIAAFLATGKKPLFGSASGLMIPVIQNTSRLSDADRRGMADYLKSLSPIASMKK